MWCGTPIAEPYMIRRTAAARVFAAIVAMTLVRCAASYAQEWSGPIRGRSRRRTATAEAASTRPSEPSPYEISLIVPVFSFGRASSSEGLAGMRAGPVFGFEYRFGARREHSLMLSYTRITYAEAETGDEYVGLDLDEDTRIEYRRYFRGTAETDPFVSIGMAQLCLSSSASDMYDWCEHEAQVSLPVASVGVRLRTGRSRWFWDVYMEAMRVPTWECMGVGDSILLFTGQITCGCTFR